MKKLISTACILVLASSNVFANEITPVITKSQSLNLPAQTVVTQPQSIDSLIGSFNNEIKLFFSDIDGTLIPLDKSVPKGTVPPSVIEGSNALHKANIPLILITGRSSGEARQIANKIGIENQYVIGQQGAEIVDPKGNLILENGIDSNSVKKIVADINCFNKKNDNAIIPFIYVKGVMYVFRDVEFPYTMDKPVKIHSLKQIGKDYTAIKVGLYSPDPIKLKGIQQYLASKYPQFTVVISADCYCDVSSKTATKGNAIKILAAKLGIDLKNVATIGDTENDISMLKLLKDNNGLSIAVDNANNKTKDNANYVSSSVTQGGFLKAAKIVIKNNDLLRVKNK